MRVLIYVWVGCQNPGMMGRYSLLLSMKGTLVIFTTATGIPVFRRGPNFGDKVWSRIGHHLVVDFTV